MHCMDKLQRRVFGPAYSRKRACQGAAGNSIQARSPLCWLCIGLLVMQTFFAACNVSAATQIAAGDSHVLAIGSDGALRSWGDNSSGQLGFGKVLQTSMPLEIKFPAAIVSAKTARTHSLALDADGNVWSWGSNAEGELGDGTQADRPLPAIVFRGASQIAAGTGSSLAIDRSGFAWEWGSGQSVPTLVPGLPAVSSVYSNLGTRMAVDATGRVWGWGDGQQGRLGFGLYDYSATPRVIPGLPSVKHLGLGRWHVLAVDLNGFVWAWGSASPINGDAGNSTYLIPVKLTGLPAMAKVDAGSWDSYGIAADGTLYRWSEVPSQYQKMLTEAIKFVDLSVDYHGVALDDSGNAWGWGINNVGQVGTNATGAMSKIEFTAGKLTGLSASDCYSPEDGASVFTTAMQSWPMALPTDGGPTNTASWVPTVSAFLHLQRFRRNCPLLRA